MQQGHSALLPAALASVPFGFVLVRVRVQPSQTCSELELELILTHMAQKPMPRAEVYAHAMRASQNRKKGSA